MYKSNRVVLDGSNILAGGSVIGKKDNNPIRLLSAKKFYEKKGYKVKIFIKNSTLDYLKRQNTGGFNNQITALTRTNMTRVDSDDLSILEYALENNAIIVTHDRFMSERKKYPNLEWTRIDELLRGVIRVGEGKYRSGKHWSFKDERKFDDPEMPLAHSIDPRTALRIKLDSAKKSVELCINEISCFSESSQDGFKDQMQKLSEISSNLDLMLESLA